MNRKPHPERVIESLVIKALETRKERSALFGEYIKLHYRVTGNLAPGCDARDFYFVLDQIIAERQKNG